VLSAVLLAGSFVSFILALGLAPVANVLIMFGATPFITAIAARIFLGEPLHGHTLFAMGAAVVGLAISVAGSLQAGCARRHGGGPHRRPLHERQLCRGAPPP
jgi:drug/metabolite transporter (DMT)-like permease